MREIAPNSVGIWSEVYRKWLVVLCLLVAVFAAARFLPVTEWGKSLTFFLRGRGALGILFFIVAYSLGTVCFMPGSVFTVAAGLVYGMLAGTVVALIGATVGAALAFLVGRYLFRKRIEEFVTQDKQLAALDRAIGRSGWKFVVLLRLTPFIPFNFSNYFYGVTAISFWPYVAASAVGMLPGAFFYAYLGDNGKISWQGVVVRLVVFAAVAFCVDRMVRRELVRVSAN